MNMKKTVYIQLKHYRRMVHPANDLYAIEGLRNAAHVSIGEKFFRVTDSLTPEEADTLCEIKHYDVTIRA